MNFDKIKLKCQCGGTIQKMITTWKGIEVRGWRCPKCKKELINPVDSQRALEIANLKKSFGSTKGKKRRSFTKEIKDKIAKEHTAERARKLFKRVGL